MNKSYFIILLLVQCVFSQAPATEWRKAFGGSGNDGSYMVQQTTDGGYVVIGYTFSVDGDITENNGGSDIWVVKISPSGNIEWQKAFGGTENDYASNIQQTSDGGYVLLGQVYSNNGDVSGLHGNADIWVVKLTSSGNIMWQKALGGTAADWDGGIRQTNDGGYVVLGCTDSNNGDVYGNHGSTDAWVVKLTAYGDVLWQRPLGGSNIDGGTHINQTSDGGYIVAGYSQSSNGDLTQNYGIQDAWVIKLSNIGVLQWQKSFGGTDRERADFVEQTASGDYFVACSTRSDDGEVAGFHGDQDAWILRLNNSGDMQWQKSIGGNSYEFVKSFRQTVDSGIIVAGLTYSNNGNVSGNHGGSDAWIFKLDGEGNFEWQKTFGGTAADYFYGIDQTADNGFIVCGETLSSNYDVTDHNGLADVWVVKLEAETLGSQEHDYNDFVIVPNPASFEISLVRNGAIAYNKIEVVDITGKTVMEDMQVLNRVNIEKLPTGIYVVKAFSEDEVHTGKFVKQ